ncbi:MAG TPA: MFS transporter [bacterium]|nr:MFS transporter [bacterium]HQO34730.1 MFS transporter [bacterium]HQP99437.1 MFS transporter [bacterium]
MRNWFPTQESLNETDLLRAQRLLLLDGIYSQVMGNLTGGAFLVAFALLLGASNAVVGILAAIGPLTQMLQLPSIYLVETTRNRRALATVSAFIARIFWIFAAILPFVAPAPYRLPLFVLSVFLYFSIGSITGCAFNSWIRDVIPERILGGFLAKRLAIAMAVAIVLGFLAAVGIDTSKEYFSNDTTIYSIIFLVGGIFGLIGAINLGRIPEPVMQPLPVRNPFKVLGEPFRDVNFRNLLAFLGIWNFAVNFVAPFYTVYMLDRLQLGMTLVLALSFFSQLLNVVFFRVWGRLADLYSHKSVLAVSGPMFMVSVALWPITTMPEPYTLTVPLLVLIHGLAGIATAGVAISTGGIALKAAPRGRATAYLATNSLISGAAASLAPILAGLAADGFRTQEFGVTFHWLSELNGRHEAIFCALSLRGLDFLFVISLVFGIYSFRRLVFVREVGEVKEDIVLSEFYGELRKIVRNVSTVAGLRHLTYFPYARLRERMVQKRP